MDRNREFRLGDWHVAPLRGVMHGPSGSKRLTPKAMDVLLCLARYGGDVVERDVFLADVWDGRAQSDEPLNRCIAELRRQLGDRRRAPRYIETIPKRGYRLLLRPAYLENVTDAGPEDVPSRPRRRYVHQAGAVAVVVLLAAVVWWFGRPAAAPPATATAIAVLPFAVVGSTAGREYFADGMHEELINELSQGTSLAVRSRRSTGVYRNTGKSLSAVAAELQVDVLLEGSVRHAGDRVRVTAQLVSANDDAQLWSGSFDSVLSVPELFAIQKGIAREIATALRVRLDVPDAQHAAFPTQSIDAYDRFLLGKYHYRRQLAGDIERSVAEFEAAVAIDPGFADAWDWLAYAYNHAASELGFLPPDEAYPKARAAALHALEIDPDLATSVALLGYIRAVYDWDWVGAQADLVRAIALDPADSGTVWSLAHVYAYLGRHDEAVRLTRELAESGQDNGRQHREVAKRLVDAGRYDEALDALQQAVEQGDEPAQVADVMGVALLGLGRYADARSQLEFAAAGRHRDPAVLAELAFLYARTNNAGRARELLAELQARAGSEWVSALTFAIVHCGLREFELALDFLEQAADARDRGVLGVRNGPFFRDLADQPRFAALVARFGMPEAGTDF